MNICSGQTGKKKLTFLISSRISKYRQTGHQNTSSNAIRNYILTNLRVIPHFDKYFRWIPDSAAKVLLSAPEGTTLIGIDEQTALVKRAGQHQWLVHGEAQVHILQGAPKQKLLHGDQIEL